MIDQFNWKRTDEEVDETILEENDVDDIEDDDESILEEEE